MTPFSSGWRAIFVSPGERKKFPDSTQSKRPFVFGESRISRRRIGFEKRLRPSIAVLPPGLVKFLKRLPFEVASKPEVCLFMFGERMFQKFRRVSHALA